METIRKTFELFASGCPRIDNFTNMPQMEIIDVNWEGPIPFIRVVEGDGISKSFNGPGVYIWAICIRGRHVAYYVGETGRSIRDRTIEHYKCYVHGEYRIFDPARLLAEGKETRPVWGDAYGFRWPKRVDDFLRKSHELLPIMSQFVGLLEMFVIPFGEPKRVRKRLEAEIHRLCATAKGDLQEQNIDYQFTRSDEQVVQIHFSQPIPVSGLEDRDRIELAPIKSQQKTDRR